MLNRFHFTLFAFQCVLCASVFSQVESVPAGKEAASLKGFRYHSWKILDDQTVSLGFFQNVENPTPEQTARNVLSINKQVVLPADISKEIANSLEYIAIAEYGAEFCPEDIDITTRQSQAVKKAAESVEKKVVSIASVICTEGVVKEKIMAIAKEIKTECDDLNRTTLLDFQIARIKQVRIEMMIIGNGIANSLSSPPLSDQLDITKKQKATLLAKKRELDAKLKKKLVVLIKKYQDELLDELSATQRKQFDELEIRKGALWQRSLETKFRVLPGLSRL